MAQQIITGGNGTTGQTGEQIKDIINENFTENYADIAAVEVAMNDKADLVAGKVPTSQLPAYVDDVIEVANFAALPGTGTEGVIYITLDDNHTFRWATTVYVDLGAETGVSLGETSATAYRGDRGKIAYDHSQLSTGNPHGTTKTDLSLGNVDNTADSAKPVSAAQAAADALKLSIINTAVVLTDAATIDITANKHTLASSTATRTFTDSYTGDDVTIELTLNATSATYTFPAAALCISEGIATGNNIFGLAGVSGDKYIISRKKIGSAYYVACKNFGQ